MKKICLLLLSLLLCSFCLVGCDSQQKNLESTSSEQPMIDMTTIIGTPNDSKELLKYGGFSYYSDGVYPVVLCGGKNLVDKTIKYISYKPYFINRVGERQDCGFGGYRQMGPINPGEDFYFVFDSQERVNGVHTVGISEVEVEYMDGTIVEGYYNYETTKVNELLK
jgi:hypothetical protein